MRVGLGEEALGRGLDGYGAARLCGNRWMAKRVNACNVAADVKDSC
jgi:hypothetical protein